MRVAVTGANGFVGRTLTARLLLARHDVRAVISERPGAERELPGGGADLDVRRADVRRPETLRGVFDGVDAVVHTVAIPTERKQRFAEVNVAGVAHVLAEARRAGVRRIAHMSALGADPASPYPYLRSKGEGQALVTGSGLSHVVLRPSLLFGEGDDFFPRLAFSLLFPVVPVPGDGRARFQPVHVDDIAQALVAALERPDISGVHEVGGPEPVTYDEMLAETMRGMGKRRPTLHVPVPLMKPPAVVMGIFMPDPPVTVDQLDLLAVDNTPRQNALEPIFGVKPRPFRGSLDYLLKRR
ncbi:MAG TPA: complex I NDUFA9 subunit family protein [Candidatus Limnocylindria bacterium]|jgi:NADH dehydrogenase|nr:complex I NDUFA9 subunit family protein [Candidatus Limnocylindria bacterium]